MKMEERRRLHSLTEEQLRDELSHAEEQLLNFRFESGLKRLTNPAGMHNARKRIAVLKTLIRETELTAEHGFATMDEYKAYKVAEKSEYRERKAAR